MSARLFSFLLIFDVQRCSRVGFLMLSLVPSPFCRLAPFSLMHAHSYVLDPGPLGHHGLFSKWVVNIALRLDLNSPFKILLAPFSRQPSPRALCLDVPRSCSRSADLIMFPSLWDYHAFAYFCCTDAFFLYLIHLHYSLLQSDTTFLQSGWILLFPLVSDYSGVFAWFHVVPCVGGSVRFPGSGVQQSWPL